MSLARRPLTLAAALLFLTGCKPDTVKQVSPDAGVKPSAAPTGTPVDPGTAGSISGNVLFSGKAPARIKIDMSQDPACAMTGGDNFAEQVVVDHGHLANTYVYVREGPPAAMNAAPSSPAQTHATLDQKGCRYVPHVVAVEHGGTVAFLNSDPTMHNIHTMPTVAGNEVIDVSQGPNGQPQTRQFSSPETLLPVRCNNHPWMNAFINVSPTPFFAVTGPDGKFTLSGLPAGDYTLTAVQEKLGSQDLHVTVQPHATATADFTYKAVK